MNVRPGLDAPTRSPFVSALTLRAPDGRMSLESILSHYKSDEEIIMGYNHLRRKDILCILSTETTRAAWFNDNIIDSFLTMMTQIRRLQLRDWGFYNMHSLDYAHLALQPDSTRAFCEAAHKRCIYGPDTIRFSRCILFPIQIAHHWKLVAVSGITRQIIVADSSNSRGEEEIVFVHRFLRHLLGDAFSHAEWKLIRARVPQQQNAVDCGAFLLLNAYCFCNDQRPADFYNEGDGANMRVFVALSLLESRLQI